MKEYEDRIRTDLEYKEGGLYWRKHCHKAVAGKRVGCLDAHGYRVFNLTVEGKPKRFLEHRVVFFMHHGCWPKQIDHINRDRADNRIENLRECTDQTNRYNMGVRRDSASGVKNVYWWEARQKYRVAIQYNKKWKTVGYFDDIELAELVAREAREKYHGEFAYNE